MQVKNPSTPSFRTEYSHPAKITYSVGISYISSYKVNRYMPFGHSISTGLLRFTRNNDFAKLLFDYSDSRLVHAMTNVR